MSACMSIYVHICVWSLGEGDREEASITASGKRIKVEVVSRRNRI